MFPLWWRVAFECNWPKVFKRTWRNNSNELNKLNCVARSFTSFCLLSSKTAASLPRWTVSATPFIITFIFSVLFDSLISLKFYPHAMLTLEQRLTNCKIHNSTAEAVFYCHQQSVPVSAPWFFVCRRKGTKHQLNEENAHLRSAANFSCTCNMRRWAHQTAVIGEHFFSSPHSFRLFFIAKM